MRIYNGQRPIDEKIDYIVKGTVCAPTKSLFIRHAIRIKSYANTPYTVASKQMNKNAYYQQFGFDNAKIILEKVNPILPNSPANASVTKVDISQNDMSVVMDLISVPDAWVREPSKVFEVDADGAVVSVKPNVYCQCQLMEGGFLRFMPSLILDSNGLKYPGVSLLYNAEEITDFTIPEYEIFSNGMRSVISNLYLCNLQLLQVAMTQRLLDSKFK